jgi:hypothetical protein
MKTKTVVIFALICALLFALAAPVMMGAATVNFTQPASANVTIVQPVQSHTVALTQFTCATNPSSCVVPFVAWNS